MQEVGGGALDHLQVRQQVRPVVAVRTWQATLEPVDGSLAVPVARPADAIAGQGGLAVALRTRLGDGLDGIRDHMRDYPYDCLEQQLSVAVALGERARWDAVVGRLDDYLDAHRGLLRYFPGEGPGSDILTAYVLAITHEAGWPLPAATQDALVAGLTAALDDPAPPGLDLPFAHGTPRRLAIIEALSRLGAATPDLLADLEPAQGHWPTAALLDLIAILGRVDGVADREARLQHAERLLRARLVTQGSAIHFASTGGSPLCWLMGSEDQDAVRAILTLLPEPRWRGELPRLLRGALARQRRGHWDLTTANAWGRLALEQFSAAFEGQPVTGTTRGQLGAETLTRRWTDDRPQADWLFPWPEGPERLTLTHSGQGRPWALVQSRAAIALDKPLFAGYRIARTLTPEQQRQTGQWSRGDIVRVRIELAAEATMGWVVVSDPVPAGATILGTGFGRDTPDRAGRTPAALPPIFEERRYDGFQAYYEQVPGGSWSLEYRLRLNNAGDFALPPTRVEALYLPEMRGELPNTAMSVAE